MFPPFALLAAAFEVATEKSHDAFSAWSQNVSKSISFVSISEMKTIYKENLSQISLFFYKEIWKEYKIFCYITYFMFMNLNKNLNSKKLFI